MTVMHSLRSRILLARVAVQLPLAEAGDRLPGLVLGGADVAVLTTSGAADRRKDLKILRDLERYLGQRVLLAVDTPELEADVRVLFPGEQDRSRPHQWALLGQAVQEQLQIVEPDGAFQFLAVPGSSPGSPRVGSTPDRFRPWWKQGSGASGSPRAEPWRNWNRSTRSCGGHGVRTQRTRTTWTSRSGRETPRVDRPRIGTVRPAYPYR